MVPESRKAIGNGFIPLWFNSERGSEIMKEVWVYRLQVPEGIFSFFLLFCFLFNFFKTIFEINFVNSKKKFLVEHFRRVEEDFELLERLFAVRSQNKNQKQILNNLRNEILEFWKFDFKTRTKNKCKKTEWNEIWRRSRTNL